MSFKAAHSADRRSFGRRATSDLYGWIVLDNKQRVSCSVANLALSGALLHVKTDQPLPDRFTLVVQSHGIMERCEVRHRGQDQLGVKFVPLLHPRRATHTETQGLTSSAAVVAAWNGDFATPSARDGLPKVAFKVRKR